MQRDVILASMLQCTTPRRPYVMDGTSHAIQLELLHGTGSSVIYIHRRAQTLNKHEHSHLTSIASTSPMRSYPCRHHSTGNKGAG